MNKEEMLEALENIQRKMAEAKVDEYELDAKVDALESIFKLKERTETEIGIISDRLNNEQNYIRPILYDESRRYNLEDYIEACQKDEEANAKEIARYEALVEQLRNQASTKESQRIVDELNTALATQGEDLRDSERMAEADFQELRRSYDNRTVLRDAHMENIIANENILTKAEARLNDLKEQTESLKDATNEAKGILDNFDRIQSESIIDEDKKATDENKLKVLQNKLAEYDNIEKFISYDYDKEIANVIADYRADKITDAEVVDRMKEIRGYIVDDSLTEDIQARDAMNQENAEIQRVCEQEIKKLEDKLANDDNYAVSPFIVERNNRQLKRINDQINQRDDQVNLFNEQMTKLSADVEASNELIAESENQIRDIQKQIRRYGNNIDPELEQELLNQIDSKRADIKYLNTLKSESIESMDHISDELNTLTNSPKYNRLSELRDRLSETLEKRNSMDMSAKRLDEIELARLKSDLSALQNNGKYNGVSLYEDFDNLINGSKSETINPINDDDKDIEDFLNGIEEAPVTKEIDAEESKNKDDIEEAINDPLNLGDTRGKRFKDLGESEKLTKKAKNKTFIGLLKKWWKPIALVISTIALLVGLKSCSKDSVDEVVRDAQKDPSKYEDMTEDEIKESIDSQISEEVTPVIEEPEENMPIDDAEVSNQDEIETEEDKMETEVIAPVQETTDSVTPEINTPLPDIGTEPITNPNVQSSTDAPTTPVVTEPVYDYDVNDESSYGTFIEDNSNTPVETPATEIATPGTPATSDDDWGEFHEEEVVSPTDTPVENDSANLNVTINNGESFVVDLGDTTYELNNSDRESNENASSFIDLNDTTNLTEDEQGAVNLEIAGNTASELQREQTLTAADIQKIRDELAAQYGAPTLTQEEIDQANAEYQDSAKSR